MTHALKEYGGLKFELPLDVETLKYWSLFFQENIVPFVWNIHLGISIIYGVFRDDNLLGIIEIKMDSIVYMLGVKNKKISENDIAIINQWFEKYLENYEEDDSYLDIDEVMARIERKKILIKHPKIKRNKDI
jgi:hypothetical protein